MKVLVMSTPQQFPLDPKSEHFDTTEIPRVNVNSNSPNTQQNTGSPVDPASSNPAPPVTPAAPHPSAQYAPPLLAAPAPGYYPYSIPPQKSGNGAKITAIVLGVILALVLIGGLTYFLAGDKIRAMFGGSGTQPSQIVQTVVVTPNQGTGGGAVASRPTRENFPVSVTPVNSAAINGAPAGNFQKIFKSGPTSDSFALQVGSDFQQHYNRTGSTSASLTVYSSVTGRYYNMNCQDRGSYVHCTGGNNANVYIS